jgi:hypothetical protein
MRQRVGQTRLPSMPSQTFLIEAYAAAFDEAAGERLRDRCIAASDGMEFLGAVHVPADEMTLMLVTAPDEARLREMLAAAGVAFDRIVPAEARHFERVRPRI